MSSSKQTSSMQFYTKSEKKCKLCDKPSSLFNNDVCQLCYDYEKVKQERIRRNEPPEIIHPDFLKIMNDRNKKK